MTDQSVEQQNERERSESITVSMPPTVIRLLDGLKDYPSQKRSEVIRRLIVDGSKQREATA
jgi:metal-responsive CopG/Arc/MetJ family transcriptional regulator